MKAIILAGGLGTRISEETHLKPKPMIEVGGRPILWHLMKSFSSHGIHDFVICCGYKGYVIKDNFVAFLIEAKRSGKRVMAYGAAASSSWPCLCCGSSSRDWRGAIDAGEVLFNCSAVAHAHVGECSPA